ncbi:GD15606 [Drosophila simulans]|uniref:GD15606 n=1 Tax=Drosophila simulans TaxID=7240 RepID=B4R7A4_DROSI|nr:GD15606 [Drosophila simulans]
MLTDEVAVEYLQEQVHLNRHNIEGIIWTIKNGVYDEVERMFLAGSLNVND